MLGYYIITTTRKIIKKIQEMWDEGGRNKLAISKATGVSPKTVYIYLPKESEKNNILPSRKEILSTEQKMKLRRKNLNPFMKNLV